MLWRKYLFFLILVLLFVSNACIEKSEDDMILDKEKLELESAEMILVVSKSFVSSSNFSFIRLIDFIIGKYLFTFSKLSDPFHF